MDEPRKKHSLSVEKESQGGRGLIFRGRVSPLPRDVIDERDRLASANKHVVGRPASAPQYLPVHLGGSPQSLRKRILNISLVTYI